MKLRAAGFLDASELFRAQQEQVTCVLPCLREAIAGEMRSLLDRHPNLPVRLYQGNARLALTACNAALVKSGTSTLEAMLLHRPMVVSYRLGELTYQLVSRLLRTPYVALPNILEGDELVPELLQNDATPSALAENLLAQLDKATANPEYLSRFEALHEALRQGADDRAAEAVLDWLEQRA